MRCDPGKLLIAALRDEVKYVTGPVHVAGMGAARLCAVIDQHRPRSVQLIGFAGGLDPALKVGDVLRIGRVLHEGDKPITLNGTATLLTADDLADSPATKRELRQRTGADAVDMETYFVARHCRERGIALDVLRAISDPADAALPRAALTWVKPDGSHNVAAAAGYVLTHPHRLPAMIRLGRASNAAARALATTLSA